MKQETNPTLSIIIPVYNEKPYLLRCLSSVYADDNVEVIVIDDGSTDGSREVAEAYCKEHGFNFIPQQNSGASAARNLGIEYALGEYITFLDSDDYFYKNAIADILQVLREHNDPIIQFNHSRTKYDNAAGYYTLNKLPRKWVLVWNKVYRKDFLVEYDIKFPTNVIFEEDRIFNLQCFHYCNKFYNSPYRTVYKCFDNKQSICHTVTQEKILSIAAALTDLIVKEDNIALQKIIRKCLEDLWRSDNAIRAFGGK